MTAESLTKLPSNKPDNQTYVRITLAFFSRVIIISVIGGVRLITLT